MEGIKPGMNYLPTGNLNEQAIGLNITMVNENVVQPTFKRMRMLR
jgi:hypothetical protein